MGQQEGKQTPIQPGMIARATSAVRTLMQSVSVSGWFGAGQPLVAQAQDATQGRRFDYPTYVNLDQRPRGYEPVRFEDLRALADNCDVLRAVIETRKDQMESLDWAVRVKHVGSESVKPKITKDQQTSIDTITAFFHSPDKENNFSEWLRMILEDMFVLDAVALYKRRDRAGRLYALEVIDGATIKPLINDDGRTPAPPDPAYQQILKGISASDYSSTDPDGVKFSKSELMYLRRNPRSNKIYGYSQVEQIIVTVNIFIRRTLMQLEYYRDGSQPDAFGTLPPEWNLDQVKQFQLWFDSVLSGNSAMRRRVRFMPGDFKYQETKQPPMKDEYDEWLARIVCYVFSVSPTPFIKQVNRATAQSQHDQSLEEGLAPLKKRIRHVMNRVIHEEFGRDDIEFAWADDQEVDPQIQAQILQGDVTDGIMTIDEAREKKGLEAMGGAASKLLVKTATGYMDIEIAAQSQQDDYDNPPEPVLPGLLPPHGAQPGQSAAKPKPGQKVPAQDQNGKKPAAAGAKAPNGKPPAKSAKKSAGYVHNHGQIESAYSLRKRAGNKPIPFDRSETKTARKTLQKKIQKALDAASKDLIAQVKKNLSSHGVKKADDDDAAKSTALTVTTGLDMSAFDLLIDTTPKELQDIFADTANKQIVQVGVTKPSDLVDQVNERAVAFARDRAAELVGKSYDADGNLIDNPDADFAILDATRDSLQSAIADGLADGMGRDEIADVIAENFAFSETRAAIIANTEIARANSQGALAGMKIAADNGVELLKEWYVDEDPCPICEANGDQEAIPLDDDFDSGDDAPPAHPNCECVLISRRAEAGEDSDGGSGNSEDEDEE